MTDASQPVDLPDAIDATFLADQVRSGELSASSLVEEFLHRIDTLDDHIGAFVYLDKEGARARAEQIDACVEAGLDPGPLAGLPLGVKELQAVQGWPLTAASQVFKDRKATATSTMVARAGASGAVPIGLTASPEFGRASYTASVLHGICRNPWDPSLTPGGSSGGSAAAVAAGMVPMATASDGAGSIRIPASFSGVVGFKGTYGLIPRGPEFPGAAHNANYGVLTTTVRDTARYLDCVVGVDGTDPHSFPRGPLSFAEGLHQMETAGLRMAWSPDLGYLPCDPAVRRLTRQAFEVIAAALDGEEIDLDLGIPDCADSFRTFSAPDLYLALSEKIESDWDQIHPTVRQYLDSARSLGIEQLASAHEDRFDLVRRLADHFEKTDLLITPTTQTAAFGAEGPMPTEIDGQAVGHWGSLGFTYPFNLSGHPAISLPAGLIDGVPVGVQIVARRHEDHRLLAVAAAFERAQPWPLLAPSSERAEAAQIASLSAIPTYGTRPSRTAAPVSAPGAS